MRVRVAGDESEVLLELPGSIVLIYAVPIDAPSWVITSQGVEVHADVPCEAVAVVTASGGGA